MSALPAPGTFVKPVGTFRYGYCLRIDRAEMVDGYDPDQLIPWWGATRFGLSADGEPVVDGHQSHPSLTNVVCVAPGVFRRRGEAGSFGHPGYYRVMAPRGQLELFS